MARGNTPQYKNRNFVPKYLGLFKQIYFSFQNTKIIFPLIRPLPNIKKKSND